MKKTPEELFAERKRRVRDAIELREPDRVPFLPFYHFFPAKYAGITCAEAMNDYDKLSMAWKKVTIDFEPDMYNNPFPSLGYGELLKTLDFRQMQWPGGQLSPDSAFQFVEKEYMKAEEYDDFLFDPTDYIQRVFLPRIFGTLEPLTMLAPTPSMIYTRFLTGTAILGHPEIAKALASLLKAATEAQKWLSANIALAKEMAALGFPAQFGAVAFAPFDYFGDFLRGTRGVMLDMMRQPDKLLEAIDKMIVYTLRGIMDNVSASGVPVAFIPLHKSIDAFMSPAQFKTFFWPSLQKIVLELIDREITPCLFWEGKCDSRLEIIKNVPRGKAIYWFEQTDLFQAKKVLGNRVCIRGNVPASMLCMAGPQEVWDYCKKLIEVVGKGGGFILDGGAGIPDETRPENLKAMAEAVKKFGVYA